jgi:hypothetical protein
MRSTFTPRDYPQAIMLRDEAELFGPFCVHCGETLDRHSRRGSHCPSSSRIIVPPPACQCHGVAPVKP